jgi:hypothetical protein
VAKQYEATFGKDVCSAAAPVMPPPMAITCDGASSSPSGARTGVAPGGACTSSSQCTQAICSCANGKSFYAASCVDGKCDNGNACGCVQQQYMTTFGKDVCA